MANLLACESSIEPTLTYQSRCQGFIYQLAQAVSNTTELEPIFELALQGLDECLALASGSLLLFKQMGVSSHQGDRVDPRTLQMRVALHRPATGTRSIRSGSARSRFGRAREELRSAPLDAASFPIAQCDILAIALQIAPYSVAIQAQQIAALCSAGLVADAPNVSLFEAISPASAIASLAMILPVASLPEFLIVPIANRGKPLGCLVLQRSPQAEWQDVELGLVEIVATQISAAMLQVQTLRQVQSVVEKRTAQLQRSMDVQGKLYEQTRRQIDQLRHLNQIKDDFLNAISHELRTPLTSIRLAAQMLRQPQLAPERRTAYLDILEQQCLQEIELINDLLTLQRMEGRADRLHLHPVDFGLLLQTMMQEFQGSDLAHDHPVQVNGDAAGLAVLPTIPMHSDTDSLKRILRELLINAAKYSAHHHPIPVTVQLLAAAAEVQVTITNVGMGIPADEIPHVFEKFRRGAAAIAQTLPGTGLGLALVRCLVHNLGGTIQVDSAPLADPDETWQTCFTLTLPQFSTP